MALRERNVFVVRALGAERAHAVALHVHVRAQDLPGFNEGAAEPAVQVRSPFFRLKSRKN